MKPSSVLPRKALSAALRVRASVGLQPWEAVCVYDLAQTLGIEVRFVNVPSLEGMYWKKSEPVILLPSDRPAGRQNFDCAHEVGHHIFDHGTRIDEVFAGSSTQRYKDPEEFLADCFAGFLLMPKTAVCRAFAIRGSSPATSTPMDVYAVAAWLGVGYSTLIHHMHRSLNLIATTRAAELMKVPPKRVKCAVLGRHWAGNLLIVDRQWTGRPIDVQVGDLVLTGFDIEWERKLLAPAGEVSSGTLLTAVRPGIGRLVAKDASWSAFVRVSRLNYVGRSLFRHLEEVEDD